MVANSGKGGGGGGVWYPALRSNVGRDFPAKKQRRLSGQKVFRGHQFSSTSRKLKKVTKSTGLEIFLPKWKIEWVFYQYR